MDADVETMEEGAQSPVLSARDYLTVKVLPPAHSRLKSIQSMSGFYQVRRAAVAAAAAVRRRACAVP
jgi:hypothetical protein